MLDFASVLEPLTAHYASWLALPDESTAEIANEDPETVMVMPMAMRLERANPPSRTALLEAAAAAALALCFDPRCKPGGEWHDTVLRWTSGRIRKVTRRARGVRWVDVQSLPGRTIEVEGAEVRAFVPMRVVDTPKALTKLQISGSELALDDPGAPAGDAPVLWLNPEITMSAGKTAAQVGHATMIMAAQWYAEMAEAELEQWRAADCRCSVRIADSATWRRLHPGEDPEGTWRQRRVVAVRDAGFTEIAPGTVTVLAQWRPE